MAQCFSIAAEVNAGVVMHPGYFAWAEEHARAEQQLTKSLSDLDSLSREYSVRYFIENMGNWEYFLLKTPGELSLIENTPFALDVGHAHQNHCLAGFLQVPAAHYHLHDNEGKEDSHLALGKGTIDFKPVMTAVRKNKVTPILEVATFHGVIESIRMLDTYSTV
jgi:sugar phosphate isomerase/epimerase